MLRCGRFQKGHPILALILDFTLLQNSSSSQFGPFFPSSHSPLLAKILERSRNSQNRRLPDRPVCSCSRAPGALACWACASQPGLPPLRAQFRSGDPSDWLSFFALGLGEFFCWCERSGLLSIIKFRSGDPSDWLSFFALGLGYRGGSEGSGDNWSNLEPDTPAKPSPYQSTPSTTAAGFRSLFGAGSPLISEAHRRSLLTPPSSQPLRGWLRRRKPPDSSGFKPSITSTPPWTNLMYQARRRPSRWTPYKSRFGLLTKPMRIL